MRQHRRRLSDQQRRHYANQLHRRLSCLPLLYSRQHIAVYLANDGELDLTPSIHRLWHHHKRCYLPCLHPFKQRFLYFQPYTANTALQPNRFGILEPRLNHNKRPVWALEIVLMPLVAFDSDGHRVGMGGGFYDRTLQYLLHRQHWQAPKLLGIAYEFQRVAQLTPQPWDVPLWGVVTEAGLWRQGQFISL